MNLIGKITIGGHNYQVLEGDLVVPNENRVLYGRHEVINNEILLNIDVCPSRKKETYLHEIIHAILLNGGHEHPESIIDCISNGLHQLGVSDYLWHKTQKNGK